MSHRHDSRSRHRSDGYDRQSDRDRDSGAYSSRHDRDRDGSRGDEPRDRDRDPHRRGLEDRERAYKRARFAPGVTGRDRDGSDDERAGRDGRRDERSRGRDRDRDRRGERHGDGRRGRERDGEDGDVDDDEAYQRRVAAALESTLDEEDEEKIIERRRKKRLEMLKIVEKAQAKAGASSSTSSPSPSSPSRPDTPASSDTGASVGASGSASVAASASSEDAVEAVAGGEDERETREAMASGAFEPGYIKRSVSTMDIFAEEWEEPRIDDETMDGINPKFENGGGPDLAHDWASRGADSTLADNWDDSEGYYVTRVNEVLDGRFVVANAIGRGVFSSVLRCTDIKSPGQPGVAIKMIRNNETMYKFGQKEAQILRRVTDADPENKRHCVRLYETFDYRNHLCIVFELMEMNLRTVLSKYGKEVGLSLKAVRIYGRQMLIALRLLRSLKIIHADLKPDNLVVNATKNVVKICDFGSAMMEWEQNSEEATPYLVSRFYRPPEVIMGATPYTCAVDMWSVGASLYELFTGKICFKGKTNNDMLRLFQELRGPFPQKMIQKSRFANLHFDSRNNFLQSVIDPVTLEARVKPIMFQKPIRDLGADLRGPSLRIGKQLDMKEINQIRHFRDLLDRIFVLDPAKRISPTEALGHAFFKDF